MSQPATATFSTSGHGHSDAPGARIGMWLFLFTELLLFGGMFLLYAVYRAKNTVDFHYASLNLDITMGAVNTVILLTSSLTMVLAIGMLERRNRKWCLLWLWATVALAGWFLVNKYFEWSHKIHLGIYPNSVELTGRTPGENLFYALYYFMTGLHAIHVIVGMVIIGFMLHMVAAPSRQPVSVAALSPAAQAALGAGATQVVVEYAAHAELDHRKLIRLENAGLYWHLVDLIWIFLFPLFYLIS